MLQHQCCYIDCLMDQIFLTSKQKQMKTEQTANFLIVGTYIPTGSTETIDESETMDNACYLANEYKLAYGREWDIRIHIVLINQN